MYHYLSMLRQELYPEGPLIVILDAYAARRSPEVPEIAGLSEIQLMFIPPGCTDKLQPLDGRIFGVLKSLPRQLWREQYHKSRGAKTTRSMIAANLCKAWGRITIGLIQEAWDIYEEEDWGSLFAWDTSIDDDHSVRDEFVEPLWLPHRQ
jgi:hypothetical protein